MTMDLLHDLARQWPAILALAAALAGAGLAAVRVRRANARLVESEARFEVLTRLSSDFYWESDVEHLLTQRTLAGKPAEAPFALRAVDAAPARDWAVPYISRNEGGWRAYRAVLDAHQPFSAFEHSRLGADGAERHISISGEPQFDAVGAFTGYRGVGSDITARKHSEQAMRGSARRGADASGSGGDGLDRLDGELFAIWNLGDNVLLAWTHAAGRVLLLAVRHYAIAETLNADVGDAAGMRDAPRFINEVLSGPKYLDAGEFRRACHAFDTQPHVLEARVSIDGPGAIARVSEMVRCYGVSLVRDRAVVLLDAVVFSLQPPLEQMAMLNSLAYSVNSAYAQLLSKDIRIDFARTTTGDGFYIWNRATTENADRELYKLMILLLADNALAQRKARSPWVPKLRAAFHVGEHYEFHQVEGLNPTRFSYIVGQVTVDLARLLDRALPGQILLGDFGAPAFVADTAATLKQLHGLSLSGARLTNIRCYLTGPPAADGGFGVNRYHVRDKHGGTRAAFNAKINFHRENAEPIFLGIRHEDLAAFEVARVETLGAEGSPTVRQRTDGPGTVAYRG